MKAKRQILSLVLMVAVLLSTTAPFVPGDAEASLRHLVACGSGAAVGGKFLCPFGPAWCAAGLLGGCIVAVIVEEIPD